jgi:hypothetical protein
MAATVRQFMCQLCGWGRVDICMTFHTRTVGGQIKLGHLKFNLCKSDH